jgi:hypothetical protein
MKDSIFRWERPRIFLIVLHGARAAAMEAMVAEAMGAPIEDIPVNRVPAAADHPRVPATERSPEVAMVMGAMHVAKRALKN